MSKSLSYAAILNYLRDWAGEHGEPSFADVCALLSDLVECEEEKETTATAGTMAVARRHSQ